MKVSYNKRVPKFKSWLQEHNLSQDSLAHQTHLSVRTVHKLVNTGISNDSTILLVSYVIGVKEKDLIEMLKTQENLSVFEKKKKMQLNKEKKKEKIVSQKKKRKDKIKIVYKKG